MSVYRSILSTPILPWRLRNGIEGWVETTCRNDYPDFYRWCHFGASADRLKPVTFGPKHHFFGYYEKTPWNASGGILLANEADFNNRPPAAEDSLAVGIVDLEGGAEFVPIGHTFAWNWQQGAMLQWDPKNPDSRVIYNDRRSGQFVAVIHDISGGEVGTIGHPVYALLPDGSAAFSVSFSRLAAHRPGYGYAGVDDPWAHLHSPAQDGIRRIDLHTGAADLIVSLAELAGCDPKPSMKDAFHYINHVQPSRTGKWIAFFHIWRSNEKMGEVRLYVCSPDGKDLRCILDTGKISHYDWRDDEGVLVWAIPSVGARPTFVFVPVAGEPSLFAGEALKEDGHCSFSPDKRWILNDTYPDRFDMRTLMLVTWPTGRRIDLARLHSPKSQWWGEIRCDLHPRWNREGTQVCVDSVHDGTRQMYVIDVLGEVEACKD